MEEKIPTVKIIINETHELTDLVREIHKSKAERLVLTFTEQSDLLISPINLRVLQEAATREKKLLISQIIQNPTGIRNSKLAGIKTIDTPSNPTDDDWIEALEMSQVKKKEVVEKRDSLERVIIKDDDKAEFEDKVKEALKKNRTPSDEKPKYIDKRGLKSPTSFIAINEDIPKKDSLPNDIPIVDTTTPPVKKSFNLFKKFKREKRTKTLGVPGKKKLLKILLFVFIPVVLLSLIGFFLFNQFATFVKVKVFVESKPVEIESILTGDKEIEEIDFETLKIPIKTEEKTESLSDSITATGKAYRGEKAVGEMNIFYQADCEGDPPPITLEAGHTLTSSGGKSYKLKNEIVLGCDTIIIALGLPAEAIEFGTEYNIATINSNFTVQGYSGADLYAKNATPFSGGTKEEYTVLSQLDIDNGVEALSTTAIEEVKSELRTVTGDWEIIEDTILSAVDKSSIKTDKQVGTEATTVNLDLTIKGTATYFKTTGVDDKLTDLLRQKAQEENLFESERDLELVLGDDIEKSITVEDSTKGVVKIKIVAKSTIKPKVEKGELENELKGMSWEEGREYLASLNYAERKPESVFNPLNYPSFLKRFPNRRGGVLIDITELEVEE